MWRWDGNGIGMVLEWYYNGITMVLQWYYSVMKLVGKSEKRKKRENLK